MLLVLAWRLILAGKKKFDLGHSNYENFDILPEVLPEKPIKNNTLSVIYKEFYRSKVRDKQNESKFYFAVFIIQKIERHYNKRGIFSFFWYDQKYVISFYQILKYLKLEAEEINYVQILNKISSESFNMLKEGNFSDVKPDSFSVHGDDHFEEFAAFDKTFSFSKYYQALHNL
jgi:hypothetical protein